MFSKKHLILTKTSCCVRRPISGLLTLYYNRAAPVCYTAGCFSPHIEHRKTQELTAGGDRHCNTVSAIIPEVWWAHLVNVAQDFWRNYDFLLCFASINGKHEQT